LWECSEHGDVTVQFLCCTGCCFPKRAINYKNPRRFPSESCRVGSPPELLMKGALARQFRDFFKLIHMSHGDKWPASGCLAGDFVWDKNAPGDASPRDITSRSYYHSILNGKKQAIKWLSTSRGQRLPQFRPFTWLFTAGDISTLLTCHKFVCAPNWAFYGGITVTAVSPIRGGGRERLRVASGDPNSRRNASIRSSCRSVKTPIALTVSPTQHSAMLPNCKCLQKVGTDFGKNDCFSSNRFKKSHLGVINVVVLRNVRLLRLFKKG
jgi:hypothetical protein